MKGERTRLQLDEGDDGEREAERRCEDDLVAPVEVLPHGNCHS